LCFQLTTCNYFLRISTASPHSTSANTTPNTAFLTNTNMGFHQWIQQSQLLPLLLVLPLPLSLLLSLPSTDN